MTEQSLQHEYVPSVELSDAHLHSCRVVPNWESLLHLLPKNAVVAEVGVDTGRSSEKILRITRPEKLHLIDVRFGAAVHTLFSVEAERGIVEMHESDSVAALAAFPDRYFDWIFIDGDHSYRGVQRDAEISKTKVKHDGLLVFDDYIFFDHHAMAPYGVVQVVNDLCVYDGWEILFIALQREMFCKAVIRKRM